MEALRAYEVQIHWLTSFSLQGDVGRWYDTVWTKWKLCATWANIENVLDKEYISPPVKAMWINEFINMEQGDMIVTKYENIFTSISYFAGA